MSGVLKTCFKRVSLTVLSRNIHVSASLKDSTADKMAFNLAGYNKYGLLHDDLLSERDPNVLEALRRMPEEEQMKRLHRAIIAQQAELNKSILPKEQWTKFEDDHYYLKPYLEEVIAEKEERAEWEANH